jgi:hypothetical protein
MFGLKYQLRFCGILITILFSFSNLPAQDDAQEISEQKLASGHPLIFNLKPEKEEGRGYKLVYLVDAPLDIYWKFKTDFDNEFLLSNKYIKSHRLVSRRGNTVITENEYTTKPNLIFRWQTVVIAERHLLNFVLLNPEQCGQNYHYGHIQLEALGPMTKVNQVAYFDFFGASFWVGYPFYGGMSYFLKYTAAWEQQLILKIKRKYKMESERGSKDSGNSGYVQPVPDN